MLVLACISSHGFGHGARVAALLQELAAREPACRFVLSTGLSAEFLSRTFVGLSYEHRACQWDVGVVQADALGSDPDSTLEALELLEQQLPDQLEAEARWLEQWRRPNEPVVVVADVPPAAARLAARLGWPLLWHGNFGWDAIYADLAGPLQVWAEQSLADYRQGQAVLRCPFALPMPWGLPQKSLGLGAGRPRWGQKSAATRLSWRSLRERSALVCFGGLGLPVDPSLLERWPDWQFFVVNEKLAQASNATWLPQELRPVDVMPLCSVVITKPGYSTFAEALSQQCGVMVVERHGFAEAEILQKGLQQHGFHRLLSRSEFEQGLWQLDQPLLVPTGQPLPIDGASIGSEYVLMMLEQSR